jgi:hypothetical protein
MFKKLSTLSGKNIKIIATKLIMNLQEQILNITVIILVKTVIPSTIQNSENQDMQNNNSVLCVGVKCGFIL